MAKPAIISPRKPKVQEIVSEIQEETRRQKFERLALARVTKAMKSISLIGNLSSPNYHYSDEDVQRIREALVGAIDATLGRFQKGRPTLPSFTLTSEPAKEGTVHH